MQKRFLGPGSQDLSLSMTLLTPEGRKYPWEQGWEFLASEIVS